MKLKNIIIRKRNHREKITCMGSKLFNCQKIKSRFTGTERRVVVCLERQRGATDGGDCH
jgi:hypothetical protein